MFTKSLIALACAGVHGAVAQSSSSSASSSSTVTSPAASGSGAVAPTITHSTAIASPSASLGAPLPSQVPLPPKQDWCPSEIFCAGPLLQTVNVADLYHDDKTFVDKPTAKRSQEVLNDFRNLSSNPTNEELLNFANNDFIGEGLELEAVALNNFNDNPAFLSNVSDPIVRGWSHTVHTYWRDLIRATNTSSVCGRGPNATCESSLIPLNHTFVVPGGRFREQYYWDSFWILEGLIQSELFDIANATLQNFMDELETIGFIPNGGRIYYLNRSQPPVFIHMLARYVEATNDTAILRRGLPLAETELRWWAENRSVRVTSPKTRRTYTMSRYAVNNTAPRPESYLVDYTTANNPELPPLNETQRADFYAEVASGAETGWDYTARWFSQPNVPGDAGLRTLQVRSLIPVCLNSILYGAHSLLVELYSRGPSRNTDAASRHRTAAADLRAGIIDLLWSPEKLAFYDFNLTSTSQSTFFSAATFYPMWNGIIPDEIISSPDNAFKAFSSVNLVLSRYNGTYPSTFIETGLQWDAPNAWPPHQYIVLQALRGLPANLTSGALPQPSSGQSTFSLIPSGQLNIQEGQLPPQPIHINGRVQNASLTGSQADVNVLNGTVINGGNSTDGEGWAVKLQRELANRYITSAFCGWRATGGSVPGLVPRLSDAELNVTQSVNNTGNMFEKFSNIDIDSAGRGGEYTVQAGFGWTNGVALWIAGVYGKQISAPQCPSLLEEAGLAGSGSQGNGVVPAFGTGFMRAAALVAAAVGAVLVL
ncbi:hypothetical protein HGRIS_005607 [Hohenbuehelia grisea]|uniref:Trehalase n=1 Tax=Hohenbuehelia grisea TaxID=104357 RepID=A0ABR3JYD8_9AGAR